jgi:[ribosomal protein S18]-alanine N-acetyltransferase
VTGPLILRPLVQSLLPAVLVLDRQCFGGLWNEGGYLREMTSPSSDLLVFVKDQEGDGKGQKESSKSEDLLALGCAWAIVDEAHITLLAVAPAYQQQGLGQAMLWVLLQAAQQRGLERATLEVRASNQTALALYAKFGFQEAGRRKRYYQDNGEDALILWRGGLQYSQFKHELEQWQEWICDRLSRSGWQWHP